VIAAESRVALRERETSSLADRFDVVAETHGAQLIVKRLPRIDEFQRVGKRGRDFKPLVVADLKHLIWETV